MKLPVNKAAGFRTGVFFSLVGIGLPVVVCAQSNPTAPLAENDLQKGKEVYNGIGACSSCHGVLGLGDGPAAAALTPKPRSFAEGNFAFDTDNDGQKGTEADLFNVVTNGAAKFGGSPMMVGRPDIPEADRKALVKFVKSLKK